MAGKRQSPYSQEGQILNVEPDLDQTHSPPPQAHLQKCPEYAAWRAAGNGQELAPPNPYNAAGRRLLDDSNKGPHAEFDYEFGRDCTLLDRSPQHNGNAAVLFR
ncbi:hypothetical protein BBP40_008237 [Aspergillus hancockii]|nr:hypothetical protein BBP40_008237 [Aspergillus hancockii]